MLLDGMEGRRAVILITDGYDEDSTTSVDDVLQAAESAQVIVYVVGIGGVAGISLKGETHASPHRRSDRRPHLLSSTRARPGRRRRRGSDDSHSRYLITYTPPNQKKDGTWRQVSVEVPEGMQGENARRLLCADAASRPIRRSSSRCRGR